MCASRDSEYVHPFALLGTAADCGGALEAAGEKGRPIRRSITLTEPSAEAESRIADRLKFESLFKWQITYLPKYFKYFDSFAAPVRPPMPFTEVVADLTDNNVRRSMKRLGRRKDD